MAEEAEPLRESGEGVTAAGPSPACSHQPQSGESLGERERERVSPPGPGQCHASLATETRKYVKRRDKNS